MQFDNYFRLQGELGFSGLFFATGSIGIIDGDAEYTASEENGMRIYVYQNQVIRLRTEFETVDGVCVRRDSLVNISEHTIEINDLVSRFCLDGNEYDIYTQYNAWQHESSGDWQRLTTQIRAEACGMRGCDGAAPIMGFHNRYTEKNTVFHLLPNAQWQMVAKKFPRNEKELVVFEAGFNSTGLRFSVMPGETVTLPEIIFFSADRKRIRVRMHNCCWDAYSITSVNTGRLQNCLKTVPAHILQNAILLSHITVILAGRPKQEHLCLSCFESVRMMNKTVVLMNKTNCPAADKIALILAHNGSREDIVVELAKAYNQSGQYDKAIETLLSRNFVPCEGGEHAIADQYMYAFLCKGIEEMKVAHFEKALDYFTKGQVLPQSLGAGIWNHCKYIPLRYREALCLDALGRHGEAADIYRYISSTEIEYFSNMHLPELPYYQALSYDHLGEGFKSRSLMTAYMRRWKQMSEVTDNGFFATTPFFMPFVESPAQLREAKALYLTALCERYLGNDVEADIKMQESYAKNNDNLFARIM